MSLAFSKERVESMKVLMLNGSAKKEGNTYQSLLEVGKELERQALRQLLPRRLQIRKTVLQECRGRRKRILPERTVCGEEFARFDGPQKSSVHTFPVGVGGPEGYASEKHSRKTGCQTGS